jgi:hypothetical protein
MPPILMQPRARLDRLSQADRACALFLPALAPFPPDLWKLVALLPVLDINGALRAALEARPRFEAAPPAVGIFACDPFLRAADLAALLHGAGIRTVVNFPTVQMFGGATTAALASVGTRVEAEFQVLLRLAEAGLEPIACATSRAAVDFALERGLRRILLHPGLVPPSDPAAWWAELAGHVAIEGGEALGWR